MDNGAAIPPDAIEWTYCIFHQKLRVYKFSTSPSQRDEIEHVVASYAMDMNPDLYKKLADGINDVLNKIKTDSPIMTARFKLYRSMIFRTSKRHLI